MSIAGKRRGSGQRGTASERVWLGAAHRRPAPNRAASTARQGSAAAPPAGRPLTGSGPRGAEGTLLRASSTVGGRFGYRLAHDQREGTKA